MRKTNVAFSVFIVLFLATTFAPLRLNQSGPSNYISLKDSLHISQSCFCSFAVYMIKRGVLGALLIFDKIFFLSTHIGRIWM